MITVLKFLSLRQLRSRWLQVLLTVVGVAGGITLHLSIHLINRSVLQYFRESVDSVAGQAALFVSAGESGFNEKEAIAIVEKVPGVKFAIPVIESRTFVLNGGKAAESVYIWGVDLLKEKNVRSYKTEQEDVIDDPLEFFNQADSLIIPKSLAERLGLQIESKIRLSTTLGARDFTVRGLLEDSPFTKVFGGAIGIMDISGAQYTFGKEDKLDRLDIVVAPGFTADDVAQSLSQALGPSFTVERPKSRAERTERLVESYQYMLSFLGSLALIVGLVLIYSMVSRFVSERRQEIGTYRALGASKGIILLGCISLGAIQGLLGGALGAYLALPFANRLMQEVASGMAVQFRVNISIDRVSMDPSLIYRALLEGAIVAAIAAFIPAWRASRMTPLAAMRKEAGEALGLGPGFPWKRLLAGGLMVFASSAVMVADDGHFPVLLTVGAQFLLIVGAIFIVSSFNVVTARILTKALGWGRGRLPRLGLENIIRSPAHAAQNSAIVSVGLLIICIFNATTGSFRHSVNAWAGRETYWELGILSAGEFTSYQVQPLKEEVGAEIMAIPGVEKSPTGKLFGMRMALTQVEGREVQLESYDDPGTQEIRNTLFRSEDPKIGEKVAEMFAAKELLLLASTGFYRHSKKNVGDTIELPAPGGAVKGRLIGIVNDYTGPGGNIYLDRAKYSKIWNDKLVSIFGVKVEKGRDVDQVRREIDARLAKPKDLVILKSSENRELISRELDKSLAFLDTLLFAVLAVVWISLINTFLVSVIERRREIGMLRAVGTSRLQLSTILLSEYAGLGAICALFTFAVGVPAAYILVRYSLSNLLGWTLEFDFPLIGMIKIAVAGIAVSVLGGLLPVLHASKIRVTEALRYE